MTRRAVFLALAILMVVMTAPTGTARANTFYPITGTGSTWSQNALDQWRANVSRNYSMTVNYSGVGSTSGRRDFIEGSVDFAISEIPFQAKPEDNSAPEISPVGFAYLPIVAGGTSFMYNLKINGKRVTNLRLSGETVTKIFTGAITKWNDPAIVADNPGLVMPDRAVVPVIRSDGSGTSAQFTLWMSKQFPSLWTKGMTSQYPMFGNAKAQKGSDGVSGYVAQNYGEGAITYVEYSYAKKAGFPVAKLLNKAGYYAEPTAFSVAVALTKAGINSDLTQNLDGVYNDTDPRTYPLSSYSYAIVPTEIKAGRDIFDENKGNTLGAFLRYVLCEGQQQADTLGYSPLPMNLVMAGSDQIKRIPGAGNTGVDFNGCNNPTFKPGDSPSKNQLAAIAPQPQPCDKQGPTQCTTGTAGAPADTPVKPEAQNPGTNQPGTNQPGTSQPGTNQPGTNQPGTNQPGTNQPGTNQPGTNQPGTNQPGTNQPGTNQPSSNGANPDAPGVPGDPGAVDAGLIPVYDEEGNVIFDAAAGVDGAVPGSNGTVMRAQASPFTLPERGMGTEQWLMIAAVVLLIGAVVVPPLVGSRLKGGSGAGL
ncbi:phosphate ABC transporter substrate-binding protein PstS [Tessaracoccus lubricantis]|uniref:Phosphate ABC transporter substrate-binding protein PstS n=1 Tax=Tessaracoccus lubricantis TaxID=545543 RepID=A0ABP9FMS6_9ACTN